jgi:hypothetical protein
VKRRRRSARLERKEINGSEKDVESGQKVARKLIILASPLK